MTARSRLLPARTRDRKYPALFSISSRLLTLTVVALFRNLQRLKKCEDLPLLLIRQLAKASCRVPCFSFVPLNGLIESERRQIVHEARFGTQTPERRGAKLRRSVRGATLQNVIAGPHVVQQEVAERVNHFVPKCVRHGKHPAIDDRSRRSGRDGLHMTDVAPDGLEDSFSCPGIR